MCFKCCDYDGLKFADKQTRLFEVFENDVSPFLCGKLTYIGVTCEKTISVLLALSLLFWNWCSFRDLVSSGNCSFLSLLYYHTSRNSIMYVLHLLGSSNWWKAGYTLTSTVSNVPLARGMFRPYVLVWTYFAPRKCCDPFIAGFSQKH